MTIKHARGTRKYKPSKEDLVLVEATRRIILERGCFGKHHIACGLRTTKKEQFFGLHLSSSIGVGSICAEAVAISMSQLRSSNEIEAIVAIRNPFSSDGRVEIVPPCGKCREIILEYGEYAKIILCENNVIFLKDVRDMVPFPFIRRKPQ